MFVLNWPFSQALIDKNDYTTSVNKWLFFVRNQILINISDDLTSQRTDQPVEKRAIFVQTMRACVVSYQKFFVEFFKKRIFDKSVAPREILSLMLHRQSETTEDRTQFLEHLLDENSDLDTNETEDVVLVDKLCQINVPLREGIPRLSDTFDQVCRLLLELFELQIFSADDESQFANSRTDNHPSNSCKNIHH